MQRHEETDDHVIVDCSSCGEALFPHMARCTLLAREQFPEGWAPWIAGVCAVLGSGFLFAYHRLDVATMEGSRKAVLRALLFVAVVLYGWTWGVTR